MRDYLLVQGGVVVAVADAPDALGRFAEDAIETERGAVDVGYILQADGSFNAPPETEEPEVFEPLTRFQFEMILELLGITQEQVFTLINGLDWTDMQKLVARKKVETGGNDGRWSRDNPLWELLGPDLGVTKDQIDEKWKVAQAL